MRDEKGITVIALLIITILALLCILGFKTISNNKNNSKYANTNNISNQNVKVENISINENSNSNTNTANTSINNTIELGKEFKQAMDSYETFIDEYIAFMTKYTNSNAKTTQMLTDYGEYMKKYIDMADAFKNWENNNLNKEEAKYYVEVQTRVTQKLLNASIDVQYQ